MSESFEKDCDLCKLVEAKLKLYFTNNDEIKFKNTNDMSSNNYYIFKNQETGVVLHSQNCTNSNCTCTKANRIIPWYEFQMMIAHQYSISWAIKNNFTNQKLKHENQETCSFNCYDGDWKTRSKICDQIGLNSSEFNIDEYKIHEKNNIHQNKITTSIVDTVLIDELSKIVMNYIECHTCKEMHKKLLSYFLQKSVIQVHLAHEYDDAEFKNKDYITHLGIRYGMDIICIKLDTNRESVVDPANIIDNYAIYLHVYSYSGNITKRVIPWHIFVSLVWIEH
jgi:hypothetical protein